MKSLLLAVPVALILLAGCKEEVKSIDWYDKHPDETYSTYKKCMKDGVQNQNCENATRSAIGFANVGDATQRQKFRKLLREE